MDAPPEEEVLFLALHHLHMYDADPAVATALNALEHAFNSLKKLPSAFDYTGDVHALSYADIAARYSRIPQSYLNQVLLQKLPRASHAPRSLLASGRFSTLPSKRPRVRKLPYLNTRLRPASTNVASIVDQQTFLSTPPPTQRISRTLLPKSFRRLKRLVGHHLPVFTTLFDNNARYIISGSDDHFIKIWSLETAYLLHTLRGHDCNITEIVKHPTRPLIVSASSDTTLRVWNFITGAALHVLDGGSKEVNAVQFSPCPDRPYVVSGGADGSVRLWNGDDFDAGFVRIPIPNRLVVQHATDTRHVGTAATSRAAPSSPPNDTPPQTSQVAMQSIELSHHASATGPELQASSAARLPPTAGAQLLNADSARDTGRNAANSIVSGTPMYEVLSVCFNAGATRLAVSGTDCMAHVYAIERSDSPNDPFPKIRLLTSLRGHSEHIMQVLFSRSGGTIVTACRDGTARMWKRTKARLPGTRNRKESVVGMGSWSSTVLDCRSQMQADARSLLSGGASGSACGSIVPRFRRASFPVSLCAAMWSRHDKYLVTSSTDTKIRVWHGETGQLARVLEAHDSEVYVMDCHPTDERILLSAGYDGQCILWDIETGAQLRTFQNRGLQEEQGSESNPNRSWKQANIIDGQFSSDGMSFVVSDTTGAITLYAVSSSEAVAVAPEEQFFSDDCAPFRRDHQQRAVHESTGVLLHLVPKGRLCDKEFRPHPPELQPNVPFAPKTSATASPLSVPKDRKIDLPLSPNAVRNRNRDALLQRAKEFRDNQEREERRLLREARSYRRRMIIEKEKASLERDRPSLIPLRDFEVPDSDYEDSDEDFEADNQITAESESSSSSDEQEENDLNVRDRKERERDAKDDECRLRPLHGGVRKRRTRRVPSRRAKAENSNTVESSDSDAGAESPEYVVEVESESENSEVSAEARRGTSEGQAARLAAEKLLKKEPGPSHGQVSTVWQGSPRHFLASPLLCFAPSSVLGSGILRSSMNRASRRMKISTTGNDSVRPLGQTAASASNASFKREAESRPAPADIVPAPSHANGAQSIGSHHGQVHPSEGMGVAGIHTPLNPSFTSERKDDVQRSRRTHSRPVEDHQGDSASCFRPRPVIEELADSLRGRDSGAVHHSSAVRSPETQKGQYPNFADGEHPGEASRGANSFGKLNRVDCIEKSVLSDSPARITRRRCQTRTRGSANGGSPDYNTLVDIDEVAEREVEILDAKGGRYRGKRRRETFSDSSGEDRTGEDSERPHYFGLVNDDSEDVTQMHRKRKGDYLPSRTNKRSRKLEKEAKQPSLKGSAWLRLSSNKHTYVPQLGDDVMYFPEGHVVAMQVSRSMGIEPLLDKSSQKKLGKEVLDGSCFGKGAAPLRLHVVDLSYEFPIAAVSSKYSKSRTSRGSADQVCVKSKTMVVLTLSILSGGKRRTSPKDRLVLSYFPVDAPEYLVMTSRVETALNRSWKAGDRFRILFLNPSRAWQYYTGTIRYVKQEMSSVMWNTVEVEYDKTETEKEKDNVDLVSPWELEPHDLFQPCREVSQSLFHVMRSSSVEPGLFAVIARELEAIRQIDPNWRVQLSWLDTTETVMATEKYCEMIPCPMDFELVLVRMCTGYYRHFWSYMHDISLVKSNALLFHGSNSERGMLANSILTRIAETSERVRGQFLTSFLSVPPPSQAIRSHPTGSPLTSRTIRPRPSPNDMHGPAGLTPGQQSGVNAARQFPVPLTPRQSNVGAVPVPHHGQSGDHMLNPGLPSRMWHGMRLAPGGTQQQQPLMYASNSLGVALPPILPGVPAAGLPTRGGRAMRAAGRGPSSRHGAAHNRRANATSLTRPHAQSPVTGTSSVPPMASSNPIAVPLSYFPAHISTGQYQQHRMRIVSNSTQTQTQTATGTRGKRYPNGTPLQSGLMGKVGNLSPPIPSHGLAQATETLGMRQRYVQNRTTVSRQDGNGAHATNASQSVTLPSSAVLQPRGNRAGSTAGEGGTHSWGRSMEGAGGAFALQASTSDSDLAIPTYGNSRSPISPSPLRGEAKLEQRQQVRSDARNGAPRYHEHSTVSVAAAESTISCGGAELQAATAESADIGSEKRSN